MDALGVSCESMKFGPLYCLILKIKGEIKSFLIALIILMELYRFSSLNTFYLVLFYAKFIV